jgi:radical SAM superfamily enzyme with C-terminal helix-hairpin-helix motif
MTRGPLLFRQRDVTAAVKALHQAGVLVYRVTIERDGCIVLDLTPPVGSEKAPDPEPNPWDRIIENAFKP